MNADQERQPEYGRLQPPYGAHCAATNCGQSRLNEDNGAYLHRDLETGKFVILCGDCSRHAELTARHRLPLVVL